MDSTTTVVIGVHDKQPIALGVAVDEALRSHGLLRVVHAADVPLSSSERGIGIDFSVRTAYEAAGQVILDDARDLVQRVAPTLQVEYVLEPGEPLGVLEREALSASMVVVGSDHVPWFERLLRSRVAGTLALHSPCPVVVVPEDRSREGAESAVVLTLDPESPLRSALLFAFRQADERGCVLQVLHATAPATLSVRADELHELMVAVLSEWTRAYPDVRVQLDDAVGDVADAIGRASRNAELVVVGRPHVNVLQALLAQPTSLKVLRRSHCPVAVVPDVEDPREPAGG